MYRTSSRADGFVSNSTSMKKKSFTDVCVELTVWGGGGVMRCDGQRSSPAAAAL